MGTTLLNSAAAAAAACLEPVSSPSDLPEASTEKHGKKKYSANDFLAICNALRTARIEMDAEVFSGAQMVTLLLEEIDDFLHSRCGSIKAVLKLLAGRGLEISERTLKDYLARARKNKGSDKGIAAAKLREAIFEEAKKSGLCQEDSAQNTSCADQEVCAPAQPESTKEASPADMADDFGTPDNDWLNKAVCQAMAEPEKREAEPVRTSSAKKDKMAKKRAKRRARRGR